MSTTISAIAIKSIVDKSELIEIIIELSGQNLNLCNENRLDWDKDYVYIETTEEYTVIHNINFVNDIFHNQESIIINTLYKFFKQPNIIYIVLHCDNSAWSFGFALIEKGNPIRKMYNGDNRIFINEGNPLQIEKDWENAARIIMDIGGGEEEEMLINPKDKNDTIFPEDVICNLTSEIMVDKIGFDWNSIRTIRTNKYFIGKEKEEIDSMPKVKVQQIDHTTITTQDTTNTQSKWWKLW